MELLTQAPSAYVHNLNNAATDTRLGQDAVARSVGELQCPGALATLCVTMAAGTQPHDVLSDFQQSRRPRSNGDVAKPSRATWRFKDRPISTPQRQPVLVSCVFVTVTKAELRVEPSLLGFPLRMHVR